MSYDPAFRGASTHSLDDKGRLNIPKRISDRIAEHKSRFVLTASPDGCVLLIDSDAFDALCIDIAGNPLDQNSRHRALRRLVLGHAEEANPDRNGRVGIPEVLRQYMGLEGDDREVVVAGMGSCVELWSAHRWGEAIGASRISSFESGQDGSTAG